MDCIGITSPRLVADVIHWVLHAHVVARDAPADGALSHFGVRFCFEEWQITIAPRGRGTLIALYGRQQDAIYPDYVHERLRVAISSRLEAKIVETWNGTDGGHGQSMVLSLPCPPAIVEAIERGRGVSGQTMREALWVFSAWSSKLIDESIARALYLHAQAEDLRRKVKDWEITSEKVAAASVASFAGGTLTGKLVGHQVRIAAAAVEVGGVVVSMPPPARHHDVIHKLRDLCESITGVTQGFLTSDGAFVGRREALHIAVRAGQVLLKQGDRDRLFSEDLW